MYNEKLVFFGMVFCLLFGVIACGGSSSEKAVTAFMDKVKGGDVDGAVALIKNRMDSNVPVKVKEFFTGKKVINYTILKDEDPKAAAAGSAGMAVSEVRIEFAGEERTVKFFLREDGGWLISNIILP
jgi:hypothetical protein